MGRTPPGQTRERVFQFIRDRLLSGLPPTVREVQQALGFRAVGTAREHLEALIKEGRLAKEPGGRSRAYRLGRGRPGGGTVPSLVPVLGRVQAGALTTAVEDIEGYVAVQTRARPESLFALRVRGDSMTGAGILPGDIVVVRRQAAAESGDVVVALVGDEATVKTLRLRHGRVELQAAHPDYPPILPDPDRFSLLGKVVELRRYLDRSGSPLLAGARRRE